MPHPRSAWFFPVCFAAIVTVQAAEPLAEHPAIGERVELWRSSMELYEVPGAAVVVADDGGTWLATLGVRDEGNHPVTGETLFYIASITKTYMATLLAMLAQEGALSLDDPVKKHLPRLDLSDDDLEARVTVRDLLSHRPGIRSDAIVFLDAYTGEITEDRYYHWLARAEVSGATRYSNVHYTLAGRVVAALTGEDWRDSLDRRLFTPAGLERTTGYASEMYGDADSATPLELKDGTWRPVEQRKTDRTMHAAGGLGTTALDAARYLRLHLDRGRRGDRRLFSEETALEIQREQSTHEPKGSLRIVSGFGLGWQRGTFNGVPFLSHGGGYTGASAYFALFPQQRSGIAILINSGGLVRGWGDAVAIDLFEAITGTEAEWKPWERFRDQVKEIKAQRANGAAEAEGSTGAMPDLSRPPGLYTGAYHNPWLGTLVVTREGNGMVLHLGDFPVEFEPAGRDELQLEEWSDPPTRLTFLVNAQGRIDRLRVVNEDWGEMLFDR